MNTFTASGTTMMAVRQFVDELIERTEMATLTVPTAEWPVWLAALDASVFHTARHASGTLSSYFGVNMVSCNGRQREVHLQVQSFMRNGDAAPAAWMEYPPEGSEDTLRYSMWSQHTDFLFAVEVDYAV